MNAIREKPWAIDPSGCGCTECIVGEYVNLDHATNKDVHRLLLGEVSDNTYGIWTVSFESDIVRVHHSDNFTGWVISRDDLNINDLMVDCRVEFDWKNGMMVV